MDTILKVELYRLSKSRSFWIFIISLTIFFSLLLIFAKKFILQLQYKVENPHYEIDFMTFFRFPFVWNTISWFAGFFSFFFALWFISYISEEFSKKIFRQQIISGLSRKDYFFTKVKLILILSIYPFLLTFAFSVFFGLKYMQNFNFKDFFIYIYFLPLLYLEFVGYMTLGFLLVIYLENLAFFSFIIFFGFEAIIRYIINTLTNSFIGKLLPYNVFGHLSPLPPLLAIFPNLKDISLVSQEFDFSLITYSLFALFYIFIFLFLGYRKLKRLEL